MSSIHTIIRTIRTASDKGGIPFPQDLLDEIARYEAVSAEGVPTAALDDLVNAVGQSRLAGKDPSDDPAVRKALARHQLATVVGSWDRALNDWASTRVRDALTDHTAALFDAWGAGITAAGETIASALPHLDRTSTLAEQADDSLRSGPRRAKAWRDAFDAVAIVGHLATAQLTLGTQARNLLGDVPGLRTVIRCTDVTAYQLDQIPREHAKDVWALAAQHGLTIKSGGLDEIRGALSRIAREREGAVDDFQRRAREMSRSSPGTFVIGR